MRVQFPAVTVLVLSLLAGAASAQDSLTVSPSTLSPGDESFITIFVEGLVDTDVVTLTFNGPAGEFVLEPGSIEPTKILTAVPAEVMSVEGHYSVAVAVRRGELWQSLGVGFFEVDVSDDPVLFALNIPEVLVFEATSDKGAVATFDITSTDGTPVNCTPPSGAQFPLGGTTVRCSATNGSGERATGDFSVFIVDTTPPSIIVPDDIVTDNPVVNFTVTATDALDPTPGVICAPASGSTFQPGRTRVDCHAYDHQFNYAFASFTVTVTGGVPALELPDDIIAEATSQAGAVVNYVATATDDGVVTCAPASGATFALGGTQVDCSATNSKGTVTGSFNVTVRDFTGPVLSLPADKTVPTTSPSGAAVTYAASATDLVWGPVPISCTPFNGEVFPIGETTVDCYASDPLGNTSYGQFRVTVANIPPPEINVPNNITREATGPDGRTVGFAVSATNDGVVTCSPVAGSLFPLGTTTVNCTATNAGGSDSDSFKITIIDTTPPALVVPADLSAEATSPDGAVVAFVTTATDIVDGSVAVSCVPASGSTFGLGTTLVQCSASDSRNNTATDSFNVNILDTTAPVIIRVTPSTSALWPPNHKMEPITLNVIAIDAGDLTPTSTIIAVSSNQPINGTGDGDASPDWEITGPLSVNLRSERAGTQDRIYTITVRTTDDSGNSSTATTTVRVTQSRRK